jgi:uncharacterized protein (UPF0264 family)
VEAARGGAHIADVEYPASALGSPYPLNVKAVRDRLCAEGFGHVQISTNIGEDQPKRSTACQAALGVALAGADLIKCGLAGLDRKGADYLARNLVRSVKEWFPEKKVFPVVFPEEEFSVLLDPLNDGPILAEASNADGLLVDTYHKNIGMGLLDYFSVDQITRVVSQLHGLGKEAWIAGSITRHDLRGLWETGVDVICVRGAACEPRPGGERFGAVRETIVADLVATMT